LLGAFEACDEDNSGKIDAAELYAILRAVGSDITLEMTDAVIHECETLFEEQANIIASVRACSMFRLLSNREITKLVEHLEKVEYSAGQVIIQEGDTGAEMFLVESGVCIVTKTGVQNGAELRKYEAGDIFGERALLDSMARTASVTAMSPQVTLRKLSAANYQQMLRGNPLLKQRLRSQQADYLGELLRSVSFNRSLSDDQVAEIAAAAVPVDFQKDDVVIRELENGDCMYIVETGSLAVTKRDSGTAVLKTLLEGDYFGEVALMNEADTRRIATVTALSQCRLLKISKDSFDKILLNKKALKQMRKGIVDYSKGNDTRDRYVRVL
jgi:CRP-like cAMP-binding protein